MNVAVLPSLGVRVTDLQIREIGNGEVDRLKVLLGEHGVVVLPGQDLDDRDFSTFLRRFGALVFTAGETPVPGFPDLNVVSNVGRTRRPRSTFHTDTSYVRDPPAYTALRAVEVPAHGGETLFTDQYRAFDTLPMKTREYLVGRTVRHVISGLDRSDDGDNEAVHPVFRRHPISGRTALYISTPLRCTAISGMDATEGEEMIAFLFAHSTGDDNIVRHMWAPGDVVMWDNGCVLHRADHSDVTGDRVMHRGMVAADAARGDEAALTVRSLSSESRTGCLHDH